MVTTILGVLVVILFIALLVFLFLPQGRERMTLEDRVYGEKFKLGAKKDDDPDARLR